MGRVKEFAIQLAEQVYIRDLSDQAILSTLLTHYPGFENEEFLTWIKEQINVIRVDPELYRKLLH